jgi:hypothetical protein
MPLDQIGQILKWINKLQRNEIHPQIHANNHAMQRHQRAAGRWLQYRPPDGNDQSSARPDAHDRPGTLATKRTQSLKLEAECVQHNNRAHLRRGLLTSNHSSTKLTMALMNLEFHILTKPSRMFCGTGWTDARIPSAEPTEWR